MYVCNLTYHNERARSKFLRRIFSALRSRPMVMAVTAASSMSGSSQWAAGTNAPPDHIHTYI